MMPVVEITIVNTTWADIPTHASDNGENNSSLDFRFVLYYIVFIVTLRLQLLVRKPNSECWNSEAQSQDRHDSQSEFDLAIGHLCETRKEVSANSFHKMRNASSCVWTMNRGGRCFPTRDVNSYLFQLVHPFGVLVMRAL